MSKEHRILLTKFDQFSTLKYLITSMSSHDFIDDPQIGHSKMRLPVILVPVVMFGVLLLGIIASKIYVDAVLYSDNVEAGQE